MRPIEVAAGPELHVYETTVRFVTSYELPVGVSTGAIARAIASPTANVIVLSLSEISA